LLFSCGGDDSEDSKKPDPLEEIMECLEGTWVNVEICADGSPTNSLTFNAESMLINVKKDCAEQCENTDTVSIRTFDYVISDNLEIITATNTEFVGCGELLDTTGSLFFSFECTNDTLFILPFDKYVKQ
ncbi:MAG: hypothetical protein O6939_08745, partial [Bacteroidetes bacterium]|nr:hypothetical protein [Bacteroidota bacterium]